MKPNYEIVRYDPTLRTRVIELQSHLWSPSTQLNAAYFEWKYERNPYVDVPLIYIAMQGDRAVGMRGFFGIQWQGGIPIQKLTALYADDLVIAPAHRNRGLLSKIMTAAFEDLAKQGYEYAFNLSAGPTTLLSSLTMGWRNAGSMQRMRYRSLGVAIRGRRDRLLARLPMLSRTIKGVWQPRSTKRGRSLAELDAERVRRKVRGTSSLCLEDVPRSAAMAALVDRIDGDDRIRHVRDRQYFDWRFQNPLSRYRFLFWEESRLEGYLVLQEYTSAYADHEVVNIVDWEASNMAVQVQLLRSAIKLTSGRWLILWSVNLPPTTLALLEQEGFRYVRQPRSAGQVRHVLLVRAIRNAALRGDYLFAGLPLLDTKSWDLRMLYSMNG